MYTLIYREEDDVQSFFFKEFDVLFEFIKKNYFRITPDVQVMMEEIYEDEELSVSHKIKYGFIASDYGILWSDVNFKKGSVWSKLDDINAHPWNYRKIGVKNDYTCSDCIYIDVEDEHMISIIDDTDFFGSRKELQIKSIIFEEDKVASETEEELPKEVVEIPEPEVAISVRRKFMKLFEKKSK